MVAPGKSRALGDAGWRGGRRRRGDQAGVVAFFEDESELPPDEVLVPRSLLVLESLLFEVEPLEVALDEFLSAVSDELDPEADVDDDLLRLSFL